jgi:hypothetical protein
VCDSCHIQTIHTISERFEQTCQAPWLIQLVLLWKETQFDYKFHSRPSAGRGQHACVSFLLPVPQGKLARWAGVSHMQCEEPGSSYCREMKSVVDCFETLVHRIRPYVLADSWREHGGGRRTLEWAYDKYRLGLDRRSDNRSQKPAGRSVFLQYQCN